MDEEMKGNPQPKKEILTPFMKQLYAAVCAALCVLGCGAAVGYSGTLLPQLEQEGGSIQVNPTTASWIASMPGLALPFTSIAGGWMIERFGRKKTHQIIVVPLTLGWLVIAMSNDYATMLAGRFLNGVAMGAQSTVSSVYIGEASSPKHRTFFLTFISTALSLGIFSTHLLGTLLHWKTVALICSFFSFACGVLVSFAPETPSWLVSKTKIEKATKSFKWYRGDNKIAMEELNAMVDKKIKQNDEQAHAGSPKGLTHKCHDLINTFKMREFYLPMILLCNLFIMLQFSGNNVVSFYSIQIIRSTMGSGINEYAVMIGLDGLRLVSSMTASVIFNKFKRRTMAVTSGTLTLLSLLSLATFLYLSQSNYIPDQLSWLPILFLCTYVTALSMGIVPLPWSLLGEIFPLHLRNLGITLCTTFTAILYFLAAKSAPYMFQSWGMHGAFCFYAGSTLVTLCVTYKLLPETRGKTLQEIEEHFSKNKRTSVVEKV